MAAVKSGGLALRTVWAWLPDSFGQFLGQSLCLGNLLLRHFGFYESKSLFSITIEWGCNGKPSVRSYEILCNTLSFGISSKQRCTGRKTQAAPPP